jgi:uncharacterized protein
LATVLLALGLVCVVEGLLWALAPRMLRRIAEELPKIDDQTLRTIGVVVLAVGTGIVFLSKHLG